MLYSGHFLPVIAVAGLCVIAAFKVPWCYSQTPSAGTPADYTNSEGGNSNKEPSPTNIQQDDPNFLVHIAVDREDRKYREGDSLRVRLMSEEPAYAYVLYQQANGDVYQIFPNAAQQNRIEAKKWVDIPSVSDLFNWQISEPFGEEVIKVIAAKEPIEGLDDPALRKKRFNEVGAADLKHITAQLMSNDSPRRPAWAEDHVMITTLPRGETQPAAEGKRFGVFFGISKYEFNDVAHRDDARQVAS